MWRRRTSEFETKLRVVSILNERTRGLGATREVFTKVVLLEMATAENFWVVSSCFRQGLNCFDYVPGEGVP